MWVSLPSTLSSYAIFLLKEQLKTKEQGKSYLLKKQQKPGNLYASKESPFGCMLFNHFNIYCLKNV